MAASGHFGGLKITFDCISCYFRSIRNFDFVFTKWLPAAILDDRKSPLITFLAISDQYTTLILFKFPKWLPATILDDRKSLSNAFLAISDQYATFFVYIFFSKWPPVAILEVPFGRFWMTENHFRSHFSPFQINTQFDIFFFQNGSPICVKNNRIFHYVLSKAMPNMKLIGAFMTQLEMPQAF